MKINEADIQKDQTLPAEIFGMREEQDVESHTHKHTLTVFPLHTLFYSGHRVLFMKRLMRKSDEGGAALKKVRGEVKC